MITISTSAKRRKVTIGGSAQYHRTKMVVVKTENGKKKNGKTAYTSKTYHIIAE